MTQFKESNRVTRDELDALFVGYSYPQHLPNKEQYPRIVYGSNHLDIYFKAKDGRDLLFYRVDNEKYVSEEHTEKLLMSMGLPSFR